MPEMRFLTLPNILSLSRIVFLPLLYLLIFLDMRPVFLIVYIIIGATDAFDGHLARRLNQKSELGKTLDSIADLLFFLSSAYFIYALFPGIVQANMTLILLIICLLALSFIVSMIKLKKPILMHTTLLRLNAVLVYFLVILSFIIDTTNFATLILVIYYLAFIEEILIFLRYGEVDRDTRSIFHLSK